MTVYTVVVSSISYIAYALLTNIYISMGASAVMYDPMQSWVQGGQSHALLQCAYQHFAISLLLYTPHLCTADQIHTISPSQPDHISFFCTLYRPNSHVSIFTLQTKFYAVLSESHLAWGTEVKNIQLEARGDFAKKPGGVKIITPTSVTFL